MKTLLASAFALALVAGTAHAQEFIADADGATARISAEAPPPVPVRLLRALESPVEADRAGALHAVLTLMYDSAEGVDIQTARQAILTIFDSDADARHRALAVRCVEASGDEEAMTALRARADREQDPAVQRLLFSVLMDHYGADDLRRDIRFATLARSVRDGLRG